MVIVISLLSIEQAFESVTRVLILSPSASALVVNVFPDTPVVISVPFTKNLKV